jgi:hypothetical protein
VRLKAHKTIDDGAIEQFQLVCPGKRFFPHELPAPCCASLPVQSLDLKLRALRLKVQTFRMIREGPRGLMSQQGSNGSPALQLLPLKHDLFEKGETCRKTLHFAKIANVLHDRLLQ